MTLVEPFYGAVHLVAWYREPRTGKQYDTIAGKVTILEDEQIGFRMRTSGNANFVVSVEGETGDKIHILGCKVHIVQEFYGLLPKDLDRSNLLVVA